MVGLLINTNQLMFQIPEAKLARLKRELARLASFIISLSLAVGPLLVYRQMYIITQSRPRGTSLLPFPRAYCKSLSFGFNISVLLTGILLGVCFVPILLFTLMLVIFHSAAI